MNKADKCSTVCTKHTWAAVSSTQQQNSSTSQVHNLCNSKLVKKLSGTKQTQCKDSADMLERIAYSTSRTFFGGFSADEKSAANAANDAGLGV